MNMSELLKTTRRRELYQFMEMMNSSRVILTFTELRAHRRLPCRKSMRRPKNWTMLTEALYIIEISRRSQKNTKLQMLSFTINEDL